MNDRNRWDDPRAERGRDEYRQTGGSRQQQQDWGDRQGRQQGAWHDDDHRRSGDYSGNEWRGERDWGNPSYGGSQSQPQQREWRGSGQRSSFGGGDYAGGDPMSQGDYGYAERAWGGSSERYGGRPTSSGSMHRDELGGASAYSTETTRMRQDRDLRGQNQDWNTQDSGRAGSQSFASGYGMESGANYDQWGGPQRREFGHAGGSNPTFGRGYGPDYLHGRGDDERGGSSGGRQQERGFFERAGDEIASWFGDDEAQRRREQDYRGHGPSDYTRSDERIREDVNDRLTDDPRVDARKVSVAVKDGEVTLTGSVSSREAKRRAEDVIDRLSGVKHVQNNLRVEQQDWQRSGSWQDDRSTTGGHSGSSGTAGVSASGMSSTSGGSASTGSGGAGATGSTAAAPGTTSGASGTTSGSSTGASGPGAGASGAAKT